MLPPLTSSLVTTLDPLEERRPWFVGLFSWYSRRFVARHFHAVRLARAGAAPESFSGPLVVALNHPSWWDPMVAAVLAPRFSGHRITAPIDARALGRYRFVRWLGFLGVEVGTSRGYEQLLGVAHRVLSLPDGALWLTPQGRFVDASQRPVRPTPVWISSTMSNAPLALHISRSELKYAPSPG